MRENPNKNENVNKDVNIIIKTTEGDWEVEFSKTTKIAVVLEAVREHFGFAANGKYELFLEADTSEGLKPERNLISYQIEDRSVLVFTDFGAAV